eukprot:g3263.t1
MRLGTRVMSAVSFRHPGRLRKAPRLMSTADGGTGGDRAEGGKLWGGRFSGATDPLMEKYNQSLGFDQCMWKVDLRGSRAYANALARAGIISDGERDTLRAGLRAVEAEWAAGTFVAQPSDEDIHTANERRLSEPDVAGPAVGGKLHTGRSRNDQVATDMRLWLRGELATIRTDLLRLITVATDRAEREIEHLMPGYTHLQPAQPVRWSHWLMAHAWAWRRDAQRLEQLVDAVDVMPLGVGALAGHPFGLDRQALAAELGFPDVCPNSLDAVSDRDFVLDTLYWSARTMVHLSRFSEDLIIYSSNEFGFVRLADAYSTGSSLMPQKKNPDALELLRGKAGRAAGGLVALLTTMKGLPLSYNKDMQEDKEPLFDSLQTAHDSVRIATGTLATLEPNPAAMRAALSLPMLATDLCDHLVRRGVPFRDAHAVAGRAVALAEDRGCALDALSLADMRGLHPEFADDVLETAWDFERSVELRDAEGGTARSAVEQQVAKMRAWLAQAEAAARARAEEEARLEAAE